ncbi:MAG TPA: protein translocase subunit SecF [Longimicrobiales bacterium]|nr:protein translocase subunit SecF [Longimicrobiales bacterium]
MRFFENADFRFIERRRSAYLLSAVVIAASVLSMIGFQLSGRSWVNYGVDFTGGTMVQLLFQEPTTVGELRSALSSFQAEITRFGGESEFLVRVPEFAEEGTNVSDILVGVVAEQYGEDAFTAVRTEAVGPKIGDELQRKALLAILLSFALTLVYLAFRFEWRFGVAAVIATIHDILVALGFISIFRLEVSLPTVAAVLTIIGYSLNDTIIVFDRIRENLKKSRRSAYIDLVNRSINDVLPRTVMTSGTTLAVLLALFLLGGPIIRDFALILILGVVVGTYSSIFVASPALLEIEERTGESHTGKGASRSRATAEV